MHLILYRGIWLDNVKNVKNMRQYILQYTVENSLSR